MKLEKLYAKQKVLLAEIEAAKLVEKRKGKVLDLLEAANIFHLDDEVLAKGFAKIAEQNAK